MKRRICETCFFYESAGLANSGWCRHPDREFSSGVRLVVRGNEIACRNGWNADLWVPADAESSAFEDRADAASAGQDVDQITSIIPARYASDFTVSEQTGSALKSVPEDVVVRHDAFPESRAEEKLARDLVTNPRAAILKAREQFKVRQKSQGRLADQDDHPILADSDLVLEPPSDSVMPGGRDQEFTDHHDPERSPFLAGAGSAKPLPTVAPVTREELTRPFPTITEFPEDRQRFESVPERPGGNLIYPEPANDEFHQPISRSESFEERWVDYDDESQLAIERSFEVAAPRVRRESFVERILRERRERQEPFAEDFVSAHQDSRVDASQSSEEAHLSHRSVHAETEQHQIESRLPHHDRWTKDQSREVEPVRAHARKTLESPSFEPADNGYDTADVLVDHRPSGSELHYDSHWVEDDFRLPPVQAAQSPGDHQVTIRNEEGYGRKAGAIPDDDLPSWHQDHRRPLTDSHRLDPVQVSEDPAPGVPRICRTCRDFRSTESGERGWCNNPWAFKHRRMVDAGVLSCETSYGVWWLPSDKVWQQHADVSRHTHETPLLDQLLASQEEHALRRDRSASGGRR